jgi:hypothetical protein
MGGWILGAFILAFIPAMVAAKKGYSPVAWWFYGFFLFIIALPHALLIKPAGVRSCPYCAEDVKAAAIICPHCRKEIVESPISAEDAIKIAKERSEAAAAALADDRTLAIWGIFMFAVTIVVLAIATH